MNFRQYTPDDTKAVVQLFESVFADSEGQSEGALIGKLADDLFQTTDDCDLFNYVADDQGQIVASIFFSRLFIEDSVNAFILSPVSVQRDRQGVGLGQGLIGYGLSDLKSRGVDLVDTYGDPAFYRKVGFRPISHLTLKPPFKLSQPEGWLAQSLETGSIESLSGICSCVDALNNPIYW